MEKDRWHCENCGHGGVLSPLEPSDILKFPDLIIGKSHNLVSRDCKNKSILFEVDGEMYRATGPRMTMQVSKVNPDPVMILWEI